MPAVRGSQCLPIVFHELGIVSLRIEERKGRHEDPEYGQFVQQLANQTQSGMEVHRTQANHDEQHPDDVDSGRHKASVLLEEHYKDGRQ